MGFANLLRFAGRRLLREPLISCLAAGMLALGIGASTGFFAVVHDVVVEPLPYPESDRLVSVLHTAEGMFVDRFGLSEGTYLTFRDRSRTLDALALVQESEANLVGGGQPERIPVARSTASLVPVLRVEPALGRWFSAEEEGPGAEPVVVLSAGLWSRRFGSDPSLLGRTVELDGVDRTVVGVMPRGFAFPEPEIDAFVPLAIDPVAVDMGNFGLQAVARLRPGATLEEAGRELSTLSLRAPEAYPDRGVTRQELEAVSLAAVAVPLRETVVGDAGDLLWPLFGGFGILLLIACANVATLLLVRSETQRRSLAIRTALGAGRREIAAAVFAEAGLLSLLGTASGLGLAAVGIDLLKAVGPSRLPRLHEVGLGGAEVLFALAAGVVSAVLVSVLPALRHARPELASALRQGSRTSGDRRPLRAADLLVGAQMALALVLLASSALMVRSYTEVMRVDPGFRPEGVLTVRLVLPEASYGDPRARQRLVARAEERLAALPGVTSVAATDLLPLEGRLSAFGHQVEGRVLADAERPPVLATFQVSPGFFETLGIRRLAGRGLERADVEDPRPVVVVDRATAERFWPGEDPIGKRISPEVGEDVPWFTVVGVVDDIRQKALIWEPEMAVYYPLLRTTSSSEGLEAPSSVALTVRTDGRPLALVDPVRRAIRELDPNLPLTGVRTLEQVVAASTARTRTVTAMLLLGSMFGLTLAAVGLYGVISYAVAQRRREMGVRLALGAQRGAVRRLVLRRASGVAGAGAVLGAAAALLANRALQAFLYGVAPWDPLALGLAVVLLLGVALAAADGPARRAARVDPVESLRAE